MKKWIVRFVSLLVFNVAVLLVIGFLPTVRVGWAALWGAVALTLIVLFIKPLFQKLFASAASKSAAGRTKVAEWAVELLVTFGVALAVWIGTVIFSGVSVRGFFWGYLLPPIILTIGWAIYAAIDDRLEATTSTLYDRASGAVGRRGSSTSPTATSTIAPPSAAETAGRRELHDGLTEEQRRMLNEL